MRKLGRDAFDFERQLVALAGFDDIGDIITEAAEHAGIAAQALSVEPDIASEVDAVEYQFESAAGHLSRQLKVAAIPPVLLRHLGQPRIAGAVPKRLQLMRRLQIGLDVAGDAGGDPAGRGYVRCMQALAVGVRADEPVRAAKGKGESILLERSFVYHLGHLICR